MPKPVAPREALLPYVGALLGARSTQALISPLSESRLERRSYPMLERSLERDPAALSRRPVQQAAT